MRREEPGKASFVTAGVEAEINVTPLVDVCLVLLIIFMVVTPLINEGVQLDLPETVKPAAIPDKEHQIVVAINGAGRVFVNDTELALESVAPTLRSLAAGDSTREVVVRGDRTLPYGDVRLVMKLINDAGFTKASLVTLRRGSPVDS
jgi:biopolymer transport protein TolR